MRRFRDAFYAPFLSDWRNFETWHEDGAKHVETRANATMKAILNEYQPPPIDAANHEALADFVARRKAEGGVATDF